MASYESYKKISADGIVDGAVEAADFSTALNATYGVKWFYGSPGAVTSGCCCLWTVPQELGNFRFKCGDLVVTVMDSVHVTVVITIVVLAADSIMSKPSTYRKVGSIPFAPLAFIAVAQESVLVAMDVLHM